MVTDTAGNTYALGTSGYRSAGDQSLAIYYAKNIKAGSNTVTVNFGGSHAWRRILISEYSGIDPANPVDAMAKNSGNATTAADNMTSSAAATTTSGDLIFGAVENMYIRGNFSAGTGYALRNSLSDAGIKETGIEDRLQTFAGPVAATFTLSIASPYLAQMVAFRPAIQAMAPKLTTLQTLPTTSTSVASTENPSAVGASLTLIATVRCSNTAAGIPTGSVVFLDESVMLGVAGLDSQGRAVWSTNKLPAKIHCITAEYQGAGLFLDSTGTLSQAVIAQTAKRYRLEFPAISP